MADPEKKTRVIASSRLKDGHRRMGAFLPGDGTITLEVTAAQLAEAKADPDVIVIELDGEGAGDAVAKAFPAEALKRAEERAAKAEARVAELEAQLAKVQQGKGGKQ